MKTEETTPYSPHTIEKKWQQRWNKEEVYKTDSSLSANNTKYVLDMFPYPSGAGLHVGHPLGYIATDIYSRYLRMNGYSVLHPMGWDAFGLPAENYAIQTGVHPSKSTQKNIETFKRQINMLGLSYDWNREINTSEPDYYRWTQWLFLQLYKQGLVYKQKAPVNWCDSCQTVLANEQVKDGKCERCKHQIVQKNLDQWFFKITVYADQLLGDIDSLDWPESIKLMQRNWIGRSEGARVKFKVQSSKLKVDDKVDEIEVFTTRPDTLFGATYLVLAPDHKIIHDLKSQISNLKDVEEYIKMAKNKTDLQRTDLSKEKTGVELKGVTAINPVNNKEIPIWVADYVLSSYGTGAIMAVPAHDERDWEFARKYNLPIIEVIMPVEGESHKDEESRDTITAIVQRKEDNKYLIVKWKEFGWIAPPIGGIDNGEIPEETAVREVLEETGYKVKPIRKLGGKIEMHFYAENKNVWRKRFDQPVLCELISDKQDVVSNEEKSRHDILWLSQKELFEKVTHHYNLIGYERFIKNNYSYAGHGTLINSNEFDGMSSDEARSLITKKVNGKLTIQYKLRDWLISRQRYWGAPIPIIYCDACGIVPVPEEQLPVELPTDVDFNPTGESPLVYSKAFHNVICPQCQSPARRESDTMDTFVDSSWYFVRYIDPKNAHEIASKELMKKWMPVDMYVGGAEHAVMHLFYARFITKALRDIGYLEFSEPFTSLRNQGLILAEDGRKMSKSLGNVVNPDDVVKQFGADTFRLYEMFMGPFKDAKPWSTRSMVGLYRFLEKVWKIGNSGLKQGYNDELQKKISGLSKKVSSDIESFDFNTAIAACMSCVNTIIDVGVGKQQWQEFLVILSPFAPHICEELWSISGKTESITFEKWPHCVVKTSSTDTIRIDVQINNKSRGYVTIKRSAETQDNITKLIRDDSKLASYINDTYKVIKYISGEKIIIMVQ